jgi:hypothetical protein
METFEEKLKFVYNHNCPQCGQKWNYTILSYKPEKCVEKRTCGCYQMVELINAQRAAVFLYPPEK